MTLPTSNERVRTREQRVAMRVARDSILSKALKPILSHNGLAKILMYFATALVLCAICQQWDPPTKYRVGMIADRAVLCNKDFSVFSDDLTNRARVEAMLDVPPCYVNDPSLLDAYEENFANQLKSVLSRENFADLSPEEVKFLKCCLPGNEARENAGMQAWEAMRGFINKVDDEDGAKNDGDAQTSDDAQKEVVKEENAQKDGSQKNVDKLDLLCSCLHDALAPYQPHGLALKSDELLAPAKAYLYNEPKFKGVLLKEDETNADAFEASAEPSAETDAEAEKNVQGNAGMRRRAPSFTKIVVYDREEGRASAREENLSDVLIGNGKAIREKLQGLGSSEMTIFLLNYIRRTPPITLKFDENLWRAKHEEAAAAIEDQHVVFAEGEILVRAGETIGPKALEILKAERAAILNDRSWTQRLSRYGASVLLTSMLFFGVLIFFNMNVLNTERRAETAGRWDFIVFLLMIVAVVGVGRGLQVYWHNGHASPELVPFLFFVQLLAIASSWKIAISYGAILAFLLNTSSPNGLSMFAVFVGVAIVGSLMSQTVKTRFQLFTIAGVDGLVAFALSFVVGYVCDDHGGLLQNSALRGFWAIVAGFVTAGILPVFERAFNILTPMILLEYSNPSHPLLLELNRRAPATYNHSLQTAALAEAAAEKIGARSALVRVGAYFHDVGKMLKPEYFTENQKGYNIHDDLEPSMSSMIIVAHTKDGIKLAKQRKIPPQVIDLIEQHHGTMLVGFFYQKALKAQIEKDPNQTDLDDSVFRYPGPIPQTKEAAILMIADAVESASRSLSEWTPQRVERLVRAIVEARIREGQFKDSGLTFGELDTLEQSFVSSMIAMRHSRVKYPNFGQGKPTDTMKEDYRDRVAQREQTTNAANGSNPSATKKEVEPVPEAQGEKTRIVISERAKLQGTGSSDLTARESDNAILLPLGFQDPSEK